MSTKVTIAQPSSSALKAVKTRSPVPSAAKTLCETRAAAAASRARGLFMRGSKVGPAHCPAQR
jgi:hypothetical protein